MLYVLDKVARSLPKSDRPHLMNVVSNEKISDFKNKRLRKKIDSKLKLNLRTLKLFPEST